MEANGKMPMVRYPQIRKGNHSIPGHLISITFVEGAQNPENDCQYPEDHWQSFIFKAGQSFAKANPELKLG